MSASTEQRKLAAIMFTDMVGYSALSQRNEALALELLEEHRRVLRGLLPRHGGREVKTTGDGFLLEFPSALAAVQGAVEIQNALHERNQISPPERQLRIRIGIHVGDVVMREGDIHGDGVNIAARIEPLAAAGGICVSEDVARQIRNKLSNPIAALGPAELKNIELPVVVHRVVMPWEGVGTTSLPKSNRPRQMMARKFVLPVMVVAFGLALALWQPWKKSATPLAAGKPTVTEAQNFTKKARALMDDDPLAVRENYSLAEEFGRRAVQLDPTDGEAWAALARASLILVAGRYDDTPARRESAHSQAERAIRLSPDSLEAGLARAGYLLVSRQFAETESRTRELLGRFPDDQRAVALLAEALDRQNRPEEARALLRQHTNTAAGLVLFLDREAYDRFDKNDLVEADVLLDQLFAAKPTANSYLTRLLGLWSGWGDLPAAGAFVEKIPSQLLQEDAFAHHAAYVWMELGNTEQALEALRRIPREFLEEKRVVRPKSLVAGLILRAAGRTAAAEVEWRQALTLVDKRLATEPARGDWVRLKAWLLALLGEKAEARKQLKLWQEMSGIPAGDESVRSLEIQMALGNHEEVIRGFQSVITSRKGRWLSPLNALRFDPAYAPIRSDARVQETIKAGENWLKDLRKTRETKADPRAASAVAPDQRSIAVLPFVSMSADKADEYLSDGMTEELLNVLAQVPGLRVPGRSSSFAFKGKNEEDIFRKVGEQLHVATVLEGSVRKAGDKLRITAQLINVADGFHLWSQTYDRDMKDILAVQTEVAQQVVQVLQVKLGVEATRALAKTPTENPEAHRLYLLGRYHFGRNTEVSLTNAMQYFNQALQQDPTYALAYCGLADCYGWMGGGLLSGKEAWAKEKELAQKALALDPNLADAHLSLGIALAGAFDWNGGEQEIKRALELNPRLALAYDQLGWVQSTFGRFEEAIRNQQMAIELDPLSLMFNSDLGRGLYAARRYDEAIAQLRKTLELDPNFADAHFMLGWCSVWKGDTTGAIAEFQKAKSLDPQPWFQGALAYAYARAGDRAKAEQVVRDLDDMAKQRYISPGMRMLFHLGVGEKDKALDWLEKCYEEQDGYCWGFKVFQLHDPVRTEPRFQALLKKVGLDK